MNLLIPLILAEVSDKIPTKASFLIAGGILLGIAVLFLAKRWYWALATEFILIGIFIFGLSQELLTDKYMRAAIIDEQGISYFIIAGGALLLPLVIAIIVFARRKTQCL